MDAAAPPGLANAGALLADAGERLRARRDALAPLVEEHDRIAAILEAFGALPERPHHHGDGDADANAAVRSELDATLHELHDLRAALDRRWRRITPLVREHEQILHVLRAVESADEVPADPDAVRRRGRPGRRGSAAASEARLDELRALLAEPRGRAELADALGLSPSRVTELVDVLVRMGEVVETRDPARANRKLWSLGAKNGNASDAQPLASGS